MKNSEEEYISIAYILAEEEALLFSVLNEHDCFEEGDASKHRNIILVDLHIGEEVMEEFNKRSKLGTQTGRGFRVGGGKKLKVCFSTMFQTMTEEEALRCV